MFCLASTKNFLSSLPLVNLRHGELLQDLLYNFTRTGGFLLTVQCWGCPDESSDVLTWWWELPSLLEVSILHATGQDNLQSQGNLGTPQSSRVPLAARFGSSFFSIPYMSWEIKTWISEESTIINWAFDVQSLHQNQNQNESIINWNKTKFSIDHGLIEEPSNIDTTIFIIHFTMINEEWWL